MTVPSPQMLQRFLGIATAWMVWRIVRYGVLAVLFSLQGFCATTFLAVALSMAIRYKTRPRLSQRANFISHLKPMTSEQTKECIMDLEKIGNKEGLDKLWNHARRGKDTTILLTGVTGYVGRAVLLQLFRRVLAAQSPDTTTKIILIVRPDRKGGSAADRIGRLRQETIFKDIPVSLWDSVISVVETVSLSQPDLGCSPATLDRLRDAKITHIVHSAADVGFTKDLRHLAASNITPALQLQTFARNCPSCERMIFVSTAYVNPANGTLDEPMPEALVSLEGYDPEELYHSMLGDQGLARSAMAQLAFPNNYTFSKCVAEHLLSLDKSKHLRIVRPGIVGPAFVLPQPGWNGNSPSTVTAYSAMWMSRLTRVSRSSNQPLPSIPVDVVAVGVVNAMVESTSLKSSSQNAFLATCNIHNLVWDAHSKIKFIRTTDLISSVTGFGVFVGHLSTTEAALIYTLFDIANRHPHWSGMLHEVFNKGPLQVMNFLQVALNKVGIKLAPGFPAAKLLKVSELTTLYDPFMGDTFHFSSSLHIPKSFNVDRYIADQHKAVHRYLCEMGSEKKNSPVVRNEWSNLHQLQLAPRGRWDLWWAMTQPNGNFAVRMLCFLASKVIRAVYGDVFLDVETTANALDSTLQRSEGSPRIILVPTYRSLMDVVFVMYITFAFPSLGIEIPHIVADKPFDNVILSFLSRWADMIWLNPLHSPRKSLQAIATDQRPIVLFLEGSPSYDRRCGKPRSTMISALQASQSYSKHLLIPMCIDYEHIIEHDAAVEQLFHGTIPAFKWSQVVALFWDVVGGNKKLEFGTARVSLGQAYELDRTSNAKDVCACIQEEQRSLSSITSLHLEAAQSHLAIPRDTLQGAVEQLGGRVLPHKGKQAPNQVISNVEKWCMHLQWMHRFAPFIYQTHPHWACWLIGGNLDSRPFELNTDLTLEMSKVVEVLRNVFDMADLLAARVDASLNKKGITAMSTSHLVKEMMAAMKTSNMEPLAYPLATAAASILLTDRLTVHSHSRVGAGAVSPVFNSATKASTMAPKVQEILGGILNVDLSACTDITREPDEMPSCSFDVKAALLTTSLNSDQVCIWDSSSQLGTKRCPDFIVYPSNESQCIEVTNFAKQSSICLIPCSGSKHNAGKLCPLTEEDTRPIVLVDLSLMNNFLWLNKDSGLACVEAGMTGKDLADELAKHGLAVHGRLASSSTVGAYFAKWNCGADDIALSNIQSLRLVTSTGSMGAEDGASAAAIGCGAVSLAIGSEGRLGVITSAVIRVKPQSNLVRQEESLVFPDFNSGIQFLREVARLSPGLRPSSSCLIDSTQCMLSLKRGQVENIKTSERSDVMRTLNDAYLFQWKGINRQTMSSCTLVFEGAEKEICFRKQIIDPVAKRYKGVNTTSTSNFFIADFHLLALRDHGVLCESFEAFVPWSDCDIICQQARQEVMKAHKDQSLPGTPFVSHRITQLLDDGAVVEFDIALSMQGVHNPSLVFGCITDKAKKACSSRGCRFPMSEPFPQGMKEIIDPSNTFGASFIIKSCASKERPEPAVLEDTTHEVMESRPATNCTPDMLTAFNQAIKHITGFGLSYSLSDSQKLELYSLYKHATEGPCPIGRRPSLLYPVARKKYDAWSRVDSQLSKEDAMRGYIHAVEAISNVSIAKKQPELDWKIGGKDEYPRASSTSAINRASSMSDSSSVPSCVETSESSYGDETEMPMPNQLMFRSMASGIDTCASSCSTPVSKDEGEEPKPPQVSQPQKSESSPTTATAPVDKGDTLFPLLQPRWYIFVLLGFLFHVISLYSLWQYATVFYVITWTASPFADWRMVFQLAQRSLSGPYGNLPLRFNLVGIGFLAWLTFVRFPLETILWYIDEIFFADYNETQIKEPLFLLGQPRSGTTKFQDVLSEDMDSFCSMYLYEMRFPYLSIQYLVDWLSKIDKLYLEGKGYKFAERVGLLYVLPECGERKAMRRLRYDLPDEDDTVFLFHSLCHFALTGMFPSPATAHSLYQVSDLPEETRQRMMEFHQKAVRKVLYRRGNGRRYLAKWVAGWNGLLNEAKVVYPDAKYVTIFRSPQEQLPSWIKLQGLLSEQIAGQNFMKMSNVRKTVIDINAKWYQAQFKFCQETPREKLFIVGFDEFVRDIPKQVGRVYDFLGQRIVPGSQFHQSLMTAHKNQVKHKKTIIRAEERYISAEEISKKFPSLPKEIDITIYRQDKEEGVTNRCDAPPLLLPAKRIAVMPSTA